MTSAFRQLLASLAASQPRYGWSDVSQLPELSDADLAAILEEAPELWMDALDEAHRRPQARMTTALTRTDWMPLERYARVGGALLEAVTPLARRYLLSELRAAADAGVDDRAKERRHQDWRDLAADEAGVPRSGPI